MTINTIIFLIGLLFFLASIFYRIVQIKKEYKKRIFNLEAMAAVTILFSAIY